MNLRSGHRATSSERMLAAIRTALGKTPGSRLVALGTRSDDPETHWFSKLLETAAYSQVHTARPDDPPFTVVNDSEG